MHRTRLVFGITALFLTAGIVVVAAQQGPGSAPKAKHPTSAATAPKAAPSVKSASKAAKPAATAQPKTMKSAPAAKSAHTTKPVKPASSASATTLKAATKKPASTEKPATTKSAKALKPAATKVAKVEKLEATKSSKTEKAKISKSAATPTPSATPLTPVQEKLKKNTNLSAKLTSQLPAGTDLMTASAGFRNLGQFVAAVNASNNLGVSFTQLKAKMVTGGMSLGQAIQAVRPLTASATIEAQRAEYDARGMIAESELAPQTPATTPTPSKSKAKAKTHAQ
jgi:hypothetical protein